MANDNEVVIGTKLDIRGALDSAKSLKNTLKSAFSGSSTAEIQKQIGIVEKQLNSAQEAAVKAKTALNKMVLGYTTPKSVAQLEKKLISANIKVSELRNQYMDFLSSTEKPKSVIALEKELQNAQKQIVDTTNKTIKLQQELGKIDSRTLTASGVEKVHARENKAGKKQTEFRELASGRFISAEDDARAKDIYAEMKKLRDAASGAKTVVAELTKQIPQLLLNPEASEEAKRLASNLQEAVNVSNDLQTSIEKEKEKELMAAKYAAAETAAEVNRLQSALNKLNKEGRKSHFLADAFDRARERGERLIGMMKRMTIRLLFYQTFGKAIRSTVDYIKQAVNADNELSRSVNILRGNILTAFQQIYTFLRPIIMAIIGLLNLLTGIFNKFMSLLTGKSVKSSQAAAKSMYNLGKATGSAGKEAKKTLASFDELIQIGDKSQPASGGGDAGAAPPEFVDPEQFKLSEDIQEALKAIAGLLGYILAGIILIKGALGFLGGVASLLQYIGKILANFGTNGPLATIAGMLLIIAGALVLVENYSDAWMNGLDWENFAGILTGLGMIIGGLVLVFGQIVLPIALVGAGIAAIVLSVHDMIKQGPTLKNQLLLFIGLIATVTGLIMGGHAALGLIIAIIGAAILIAGNFGDQWSNIMEHVGQIVQGFVKLVKDLINGDYKAAWEDAKDILKGFVNFGIDLFEGLVKAAIKAVNKIIDAINGLGFGPVPDWVPIIGGKEFRLNLPKISTSWALPRLAQGAVIPPNKEFMAVLGDQKYGTNIETPLDTMIQAFTTALDSRGNSQTINIRFEGSLAQLARVLKPYIEDDDTRQGRRSSNGLIIGGSY